MGKMLGTAACAALFAASYAWAETVHIEAEDYKVGGEGVAFHDNDVGNNGGFYRTATGDDVDIENGTEGPNVGWTNAGEWEMLAGNPGKWDLNPGFQGGTYYVRVRVASPGGGGPISFDVSGQTVSLNVPDTGDWQNWTTVQSGTNPWYPSDPRAALVVPFGRQAVRANDVGTNFNWNWVEFTTDKPALAPFVPQRNITAALPKGGAGFWGVRELWQDGTDVPDLNSLTDVVNAINSPIPQAVIKDYTLPYINIWDSGGTGRFTFPAAPDQHFKVVQDGLVALGAVDDAAIVASGRVRIPEAGIYSFIVNSDDGFELSIDGNILSEAGLKGSSDVRAVAELTAGDHDIRVIYWERGGGAEVEVFAAKGDKDFDSTFAPIGFKGAHVEVNVPGMKNVQAAATAPGTYTGVANDNGRAVDGIAHAKDVMQAAITGGTVILAPSLVDRVNHGDPDSGGGGNYENSFTSGRVRLPFPNDTPGVDDNDFVFGAQGKLLIPKTGTYFLGFESDDGAALQIVGQTWDSIVEDWTGFASINGDWLQSDSWTGNSHTIGKIELTAGEYDFNFISFEGGGGAYATVIGSDLQGLYFVLAGDPTLQVFDVPAGLELVPEPGSMMLLGLGALGLMLRRRRA